MRLCGKLLRGFMNPNSGRLNQPRPIRANDPVTVAGIGPWLVIDRLKNGALTLFLSQMFATEKVTTKDGFG